MAITERNFLDIYTWEKWNSRLIPVFQVGQTFEPTELTMQQSQTTPPLLLTEADLITEMDKNG